MYTTTAYTLANLNGRSVAFDKNCFNRNGVYFYAKENFVIEENIVRHKQNLEDGTDVLPNNSF